MPPPSLLGPIALLGSGETSLSGGRIFESLAQNLPSPLRIVILETPAGFELNSSQVAGRVAEFLATRLQNYNPRLDLLPARKRGTPFSPDDINLLTPLLRAAPTRCANLIFMGPGSPTYAVRQLRGSLAWDILRANEEIPAGVLKLAEARRRARLRKDWAAADNLRQQIANLGWQVLDTPDGSKVIPLS